MNCKNCGAILTEINNNYVCNYCGSIFIREEFHPVTLQNNEFRIVGGVLLAYLGNKSCVEVPYGTIAIGRGAFKNNIAITKIVFPKTVIQIGNNAFEGCNNLTEIADSSNIAVFGDECFKFAGLKHIVIGKNVTYLGKGCFSRMPNLQSVSYFAQKELRLNYTFAYCSNLIEVIEDKFHFFPSGKKYLELKNNPNNNRPTLGDAFVGTPYIKMILDRNLDSYKKGICPECGGKIRKGLFHSKCKQCDIDYKN